jgi:hypothetical protein
MLRKKATYMCWETVFNRILAVGRGEPGGEHMTHVFSNKAVVGAILFVAAKRERPGLDCQKTILFYT